ncbi:MAG TPA: MgtC/SapB family protein [Candidatus Paceibacterota bacterium]|nr:MgtC/SapB family protein [Candidatus Paceibacterota bacterium]
MEFSPMLTFEPMAVRLLIAIALGAIIGLERELVGKDAGIRTAMLVAAGACMFAMMSITLPYIVSIDPANLPDVMARNSGFLPMAANIVVGIGFLGAGIIIKNDHHVRGLTTAAVVWAAAAVGTAVGLGLESFAAFATILITLLLYILRRIKLYEFIRPGHKVDENAE